MIFFIFVYVKYSSFVVWGWLWFCFLIIILFVWILLELNLYFRWFLIVCFEIMYNWRGLYYFCCGFCVVVIGFFYVNVCVWVLFLIFFFIKCEVVISFVLGDILYLILVGDWCLNLLDVVVCLFEFFDCFCVWSGWFGLCLFFLCLVVCRLWFSLYFWYKFWVMLFFFSF